MQNTGKGLSKLRNVYIVDERYMFSLQKQKLPPSISANRIISCFSGSHRQQKATVALWGHQAEAFDAQCYMEMAAKGPPSCYLICWSHFETI